MKNRDKNYYIVKKRVSFIITLRDIFLTLLMWGLLIYLLYPLFALVVWKIFNINLFFYYNSLIQIEKFQKELFSFLISTIIMIAFITILIISWGNYNKKRFNRYKNRRKIMPKPITTEILAKTFNNSIENINHIKKAKYIQVYHTNKNSIIPKNIFKKIDDINIQYINIIFNDDWEFVRKTSEFGFTHKYQN